MMGTDRITIGGADRVEISAIEQCRASPAAGWSMEP